MRERSVSVDTARRIYDLIGARYDWAESFESKARSRAIRLLEFQNGQNVLHVGIGSGSDQAEINRFIAPDGKIVGLDISFVMARLTRRRTNTPIVQADAHFLPFGNGCFDRVFSAYLLDLIAVEDIPLLLAEFGRVLNPGGCVGLVSMTEGVDFTSRLLTGLWKLIYAVTPIACAGCRPLTLSAFIQKTSLNLVHDEVVVQTGVASEILIARRI